MTLTLTFDYWSPFLTPLSWKQRHNKDFFFSCRALVNQHASQAAGSWSKSGSRWLFLQEYILQNQAVHWEGIIHLNQTPGN